MMTRGRTEYKCLPSTEPSSLSLSSWSVPSSSLDKPDMNSSSESMVLPVVSGVGGAETAAAEAAILLLDLCTGLEDPIASAAFLFFSWEEMVSTG
jgi:hypothetical protein